MMLFGSRTRAMLDMTLFALVAGLIVIFPGQAVPLALKLSLFVPALLVSLACAHVSHHRLAVFLGAFGGGLGIGWILTPTLHISWSESPTFWDWYLIDVRSWCPAMLGGATVCGLIGVVISRRIATPRH